MEKTNIITLNTHVDSRGSFTEIFKNLPDIIVQVNLSISLPGIKRAWHRHRHQVDYICVLQGKVTICLSQEKEKNEERKIQKFYLTNSPLQLVRIEKNVWHGTRNMGKLPAMILYGHTSLYNPFDPDEEKKELLEGEKKYAW